MWKIYFGGNLEIYIFDGFCDIGGGSNLLVGHQLIILEYHWYLQ